MHACNMYMYCRYMATNTYSLTNIEREITLFWYQINIFTLSFIVIRRKLFLLKDGD